jgi:predicted RNA binding protein YcfA (HicA-like mRNA interferase family)
VSKLPVVSGADVVRALEKVVFVVYRQRHFTIIRNTPAAQATIPNHKEIDRATWSQHHRRQRMGSGSSFMLVEFPYPIRLREWY